jgi:hypothetical protein
MIADSTGLEWAILPNAEPGWMMASVAGMPTLARMGDPPER